MQIDNPYNKDKLDSKVLYLEYAIKELEEYMLYKKEHGTQPTFEDTIDKCNYRLWRSIKLSLK